MTMRGVRLWIGAALLAGCGGGGDSNDAATDGTDTTVADTVTMDGSPTADSTVSTSTTDDTETSAMTRADTTGDDVGTTADDASTDEGTTAVEPIVEPYVTFFGGAGQDQLRGTALDGAGNLYFTGGTASATIPGCTGQSAGDYDVIVGRIDADGSLAWCRYIGGSGYDRFYDIELSTDASRVVIAGRASVGFPVTAGVWDTTFAAGQSPCGGPYGTQDGAVCSLDAASGDVQWCTYTGFANGCDFIRTIAIDANDDVILGTGFVGDVSDPQYDAVFLNGSGGGMDGIVGRLSADGTTLHWYRYIGGSGDSAVEGMVAVDAAGIYYAPAWTNDTNHATVGAYDATHNGQTDQYLVRLSLDGTSIEYASYFGGSGGDDSGMHALVTTDVPGVVFLKAGTTSPNWPTTPGTIAQALQGTSDCGVVKVDTMQTGAASLLAGTLLGGSGFDFCEGAAWADGALALSGATGSNDLPVTARAWQSMAQGGEDGWVAVVDADLATILYMSYLAGSADESTRAVAADHARVLAVGVTASDDFATTPNAIQPVHAGAPVWDAFVAVLPY